VFGVQLAQRVDGVGGATAPGFARVDVHARQVAEGELAHRQPVLGGR
jgi:hypothetical protein